jgi:hypothetical protein
MRNLGDTCQIGDLPAGSTLIDVHLSSQTSYLIVQYDGESKRDGCVSVVDVTNARLATLDARYACQITGIRMIQQMAHAGGIVYEARIIPKAPCGGAAHAIPLR